MNKTLPLVLIVALAAALFWTLFGWDGSAEDDAAHQPLSVAEAPKGGDFVLTGTEGPVALQDFRGKVVILYFGYTWCPDICPTSLGFTSAALSALSPEELARVQTLFVSVDPERDSPERLKDYVEYFHPSMKGVTGTPEQVDTVARLYGAAYRVVKEQPDSNYVVDHSASLYLIDTEGRLRHILQHGTPPEKILAQVRALLAAAP